jgi:hypothetical protein
MWHGHMAIRSANLYFVSIFRLWQVRSSELHTTMFCMVCVSLSHGYEWFDMISLVFFIILTYFPS